MKHFKLKKIFQTSVAVLSILFFQIGYTATTVPSSAETSRVIQQVSTTESSAEQAAAPPGLVVSPKEAKPMPAQMTAIKFKFSKFILQGNTVYSDTELLALFPKKSGEEVTLKDIQQFANDITAKYNKDGYILSEAILPPQHIKNGIIKIEVIEGYIDQVNVEGNVSPRIKALLKRYGEKGIQKKPFQEKNLERALLLANDIPGIQVKSVIAPSKTKKAAADLTLIPEFKPLDLYLDYDNRGTRYIGPTRVIASGDVNWPLGDGAITTLRVSESGYTSEMRYLEMEHKQLFGTNGLTLDIDGQLGFTHPEFILTRVNTIGHNKVVLLTLQYPVIRSRAQDFYINGGFNYINSKTTQLNQKLYNDLIRPIFIGFAYDLTDSHSGYNTISGTATRGLNMMGASQPDNLVSRTGAIPNFTKFALNVSRIQAINTAFSIAFTASGQYACNPLYIYEQFGYGGLPYGDAYDPSEIIADEGVEAKIEFRLDTFFPIKVIPVQYYVNYDGGVLWNRNIVNTPFRQAGTSTGVGIRSTPIPHVSLSLELAKPLDRSPAAIVAIPGFTGNPRAFRGFFSLTVTA